MFKLFIGEEVSNIILTDIDGVCLDWWEPFNKFWPEIEHHGRVGHIMVPDEVALDFQDTWLHRLPVLYKSNEFIKNLNDDGYDFIGISAFTMHPRADAHRLKRDINLFTHFGPVFTKYANHWLPYKASKEEVLQSLYDKHGSCWWIEDHPGHAIDGYNAGHRSILLTTREVTENYPFPVVSSWEEIFKLIKNKA